MRARIITRGIIGLAMVLVLAVLLLTSRGGEDSIAPGLPGEPLAGVVAPTEAPPSPGPTETPSLTPTPTALPPEPTPSRTPAPTATATLEPMPMTVPPGPAVPPLPLTAFVAEEYFQAHNKRDIGAVEALFSDDSVYVFGPVATATGSAVITLNGKAEIVDHHRKTFRDRPGKLDISDAFVKGDTLAGNFSIVFDDPQSAGADSISGAIKIVAEGSRIMRAEFVLDEESQSKLAEGGSADGR